MSTWTATPDSHVSQPVRISRSRVGTYLAIALGGAVVVALLLRWLATVLSPSAVWIMTPAVALLYMPLPLVAGLVVERMAGRRLLLVRAWRGLGSIPRRVALLSAGILPVLAVVVLALVLSAALAWLGVPGAGSVITTQAELLAQLEQISPVPLPEETAAGLPPLPLLLGLTLLQGLLAGATINAVVALGEEYGWRGVLAEELAPLGMVRSHLFIGVIWGLWHAPAIVLLGHNFGAEWGWGIIVMVLMCVPMGFVLAWVAARSGVVGAAIAHGVINGTLGVSALMFAGASPLVTPPGLALAVASVVVAVGLWRLWGRPDLRAESPSPTGRRIELPR